MKASGLKKGDKVVVIGGGTIKSLAIVLATAALAGVVASFATDAGERVLLDRIGQINPRILFAEPKYRYNGKEHGISERVQGVWDNVEKPEGAEITSTGKGTPTGWISLNAFLKRDDGGSWSSSKSNFIRQW